MDSRKIFCVIVNIYLYCVSGTVIEGDTLQRNRRQLLFPNSTLLQFNAGIGTPSPVKNVNVNFAFQANFQLPWNRTQIPIDILNAYSGYDGDSRKTRDTKDSGKETKTGIYEYKGKDIGGKSGKIRDTFDFEKEKKTEKYKGIDVDGEFGQKRDSNDFGKEKKTEKYKEGNVSEDSNDKKESEEMKLDGDYENDAKLFHLYKYVEDVLNGFGHDGHSCVKQALCEIGAVPLYSEDEEDLLHELASFMLNPDNDVDHHMMKNHEAMTYVQAYRHGQDSRRCIGLYENCKFPLVDVFTKIHHLPL